MKNLVRTVSVEVNGKKVDIRFFSDPDIIEDVERYEEEHPEHKGAVLCKRHCKLHNGKLCEKLKDPYHQTDNSYCFVDFCVSAGIGLDSRKFDNGVSLSLEELKEELKDNPDLYNELLYSSKRTGKKNFNIEEVIDVEDDISLCTIPCYEDVKPIIEDLKF
jgi:hypothetical protein